MIVSRVTSNSAMVGGVFISRPGGMPSGDWRDFWEPSWRGYGEAASNPVDQRLRTLINFDAFRAMVFGAVIPKPPTVTQIEWEVFWQARSSRPALAVTNKAADEAFIRERERTARKPKVKT